MPIGGILSGTAGLIGSIGGLVLGRRAREQHGDISRENFDLQSRIHSENLGQQQEVHSWNKQMQERSWDREDNAAQRRAADLEGAGLSKTLAAGSAAGSSSPMRLNAPQSGVPQRSHAEADASQNQAQNWFNLATQSQSIARTQEQIKMMKQQRKTEEQNTQIKSIEAEYARDQVGQTMALTRERAIAQRIANDFDEQTFQTRADKVHFERYTAEYLAGKMRWDQLNSELQNVMSREKIRELRHNLRIYERLGLPTDAGMGAGIPGALLRAGTIGSSHIDQLLRKREGAR